MIFAIDFDGTCVSHEFPNIGKDIGAIPVLKELVEKGHKLILWTMRADREVQGETDDEFIINATGTFLTDAINWFKNNDIPLWGIQKNPNQTNWTTSPKAYADMYIDDAALGIPLCYPDGERPYVNWIEVEKMLKEKGII